MAVTSAGAASATGRMTTGMRTTWPLSPVQVMKPVVYAFSAAVVRVNVTVQFVVDPGAAVNDVADGVTVIPARPCDRDGVRLRLRADARRRPLDRLRAGEIADRDRRLLRSLASTRIARP